MREKKLPWQLLKDFCLERPGKMMADETWGESPWNLKFPVLTCEFSDVAAGNRCSTYIISGQHICFMWNCWPHHSDLRGSIKTLWSVMHNKRVVCIMNYHSLYSMLAQGTWFTVHVSNFMFKLACFSRNSSRGHERLWLLIWIVRGRYVNTLKHISMSCRYRT